LTAGYSATPLVKKLGIKPGQRIAVLNAPADFARTLGGLPAGVDYRSRLGGSFDLVQFFTTRRTELTRRLPALVRALQPRGMLWLCWPKQSSGIETDMGKFDVRRLGLDTGLVDVKVCAIDYDWSGLKFVRRRP